MTRQDFDHIFNSYHAALCIFATGLVGDMYIAEDLVEDVFIRVWQRDEKKMAVEDYRSFLYQAVRNSSFKYLKQAKSIQLDHSLPLEVADEENMEHLHIEINRQMMLALEQLPSQCSKVVQMVYIENLPTPEIALQLGITESTVYNHKARGISLLRKMLSRRAFQSLFSLLSTFFLY
jgi:RNA polymerase sigma-70 factor (family 1)